MAGTSRLSLVRDFFEAEGPMFFGHNNIGNGSRKVTNSEMIAFKRDNPAGFEQVAAGIENGSLTY